MKLKSSAWYENSREAFLADDGEAVARQLALRAADESLEVDVDQSEEWRKSVRVLQSGLNAAIPILKSALRSPTCEAVRSVILEYDFRRRGLRMDCILLADGVVFVIEFKRTKVAAADRDQVMNYAVNLVEFHAETRKWCESRRGIVVPVVALTTGKTSANAQWPGLSGHSWSAIAGRPIECSADGLRATIETALAHRRTTEGLDLNSWLSSAFEPSSSILDAALSLYGNHDVVAIRDHAAPAQAIAAATEEIRRHIGDALADGERRIVFLSGAPGAGKTLVGLDLVLRGAHAAESTFVTGNAPLVEVLSTALEKSYRSQGASASAWKLAGYHRSDARFVAGAATHKIVKAHNFLNPKGAEHKNRDGRIVVFDEAQRTYEKGRRVMGAALEDHEADLVLAAQEKAFPTGGTVVVALVGHNQAINRGELGIAAWLDAAQRRGWTYSIADETLDLAELSDRSKPTHSHARKRLADGHLRQSMRYYRNTAQERWVDAVLNGDAKRAQSLAEELTRAGDTVYLTRSLADARAWARRSAAGAERAGVIASGQARRLAAVGLFVDLKPDISDWMLRPTTDIRASNSLEFVQNQYQVQGLELDYTIACWDADLRREDKNWAAYRLVGADWDRDNNLTVAKNGYRVVLTRARKGMTIFVPEGDATGTDVTRHPRFYDATADFLRECGARAFT
ncbi:MAG: DUF2075 domain-containing protein [Planctomycetia bacterium]|nr:DUF2075 domain-containing protein [Planctomycetia bacterium]